VDFEHACEVDASVIGTGIAVVAGAAGNPASVIAADTTFARTWLALPVTAPEASIADPALPATTIVAAYAVAAIRGGEADPEGDGVTDCADIVDTQCHIASVVQEGPGIIPGAKTDATRIG
jgi:hypothetical protein